MSGENTAFDEMINDFSDEVLGEDDAPSTVETDDGVMLSQDETDNTDAIESEMPGSDQEGGTDNDQSDKSKTDGNDDVAAKSGNDEDGDGKSSTATAFKPPKTVTYDRFSEVRSGGRKAERALKAKKSENTKLKEQVATLENKLQHNERSAKAEGVELSEYSSEITDELLDRVEAGDPAAMREALELQREFAMTEDVSNDVEQNTDSWISHIEDDGVADTLDDWQDDKSDAGEKRMQIALQVEKVLWSNPENRSLPADDFGKLLIEQTNDQFIAAAGEIAEKQLGVDSSDDELPDNLSGGSGGSLAPRGDDALMDLDGEALQAAIDAEILGR